MSLEDILEADEPVKRKRQAKLRSYDFSDEDEIILVPIGDIHMGSKNCDMDYLRKTLNWIEETPNAYIVGMGDYIENATRKSVSDIYSQRMSPQEQLDTLEELLRPLAEKNKILGLITGNHELRTYKETGVEPTSVVSKMLGANYFGDAQFLKIRVGDNNYHLYAVHGSSGAWTPGGKLNALMRLDRVADVDLYMMGHVHELGVHSNPRLMVNNRNRTVVERKKFYVMTGHFLDYMDSYAQRKSYMIGKKGVATITLGGKKWNISVDT